MQIHTFLQSLCRARCSPVMLMASRRRSSNLTILNAAPGPLSQGEALNCLIGENENAVLPVKCSSCDTPPWGSVHVPNRFFDSQIKHLRLLPFDDAMERIAGAVPVCMLHLIWTCVLDQHFVRCALSGDLECDAMILSWPTLLICPHASIISRNL